MNPIRKKRKFELGRPAANTKVINNDQNLSTTVNRLNGSSFIEWCHSDITEVLKNYFMANTFFRMIPLTINVGIISLND